MSKTYINGMSAKRINWSYWEFFNISINLEKIQEYKNDKGYVNVVMSKRKESWKYWETETFTLNEWKPKEENTNSNDIDIDSIPF